MAEDIEDIDFEDNQKDTYTCQHHSYLVYEKPGKCEVCKAALCYIIKYTPVFTANKAAFESNKYRAVCNEGSSRSSKTYSEMQLVSMIGLMPEVYGKYEISVTSPSLPHLKKGARKDFLSIANKWKFFNENDFNRTDNIYTFQGGTSVEFFGCDNADKLRGPGRDILFINEANLISFSSYTQLAMRTTKMIFLDYNPAEEHSWVYKIADKESTNGKKGNLKIHSTYLNNLGNLPQPMIDEIESLKDADENLWKVFGLGLRGTSTETIYTHWKECESFPQCDQVALGLDFGFNHPNVLVKVGELEGKHYVDELIYETKLTTDDLIYLIKSLGITDNIPIYCDSARPDTIEELNRAGLWALSSDKSVWDGIQFVKSKPLYITKKSINLLKEIKSYKWMVDKNGIVTEKPVKFKDDGMDAMRYPLFTFFNKPLIQYAGATY